MKERPILFSGAMVRALLAGTKTQTRRVVKPQPTHGDKICRKGSEPGWIVGQMRDSENAWRDLRCPYGVPSDRLWVREAFRFTDPFDSDTPTRVGERSVDAGYKKPWAPLQFEADMAQQNWVDVGTPTFPPKDITAGKLRPSMFMPRWASRILLEITEVRVERLQDVSEADCVAEGIGKTAYGFWSTYGQGTADGTYSPYASYRALWESINGPDSWNANPWVWVVGFRIVSHAAPGAL